MGDTQARLMTDGIRGVLVLTSILAVKLRVCPRMAYAGVREWPAQVSENGLRRTALRAHADQLEGSFSRIKPTQDTNNLCGQAGSGGTMVISPTDDT